ncbi:MAG: hypothetical protein ACYTFX_10595 [Planctomycetota bacterium]|jgi:hypothetical protein
MADKQQNIAANPDRHLIFFEGSELAFNYKTGQWSRVPAYDTYGMYTIFSKDQDIGLVVYSSGSVDLQEQQTSDPEQTATLATAAIEPNQGGRCVVTGVRPYANGGTTTVQVGSKDTPSETINWSTTYSLNSRTGMATLRKEGRYVSAQFNITGSLNQIFGADIEFNVSGNV